MSTSTMGVDMDPAAFPCAACPAAEPARCMARDAPGICVWVARGNPDWIALVATGEGSHPAAPECRHRAGRWACSERIAFCALGHGQVGIIEPEDCRGCSDADP